MPDKVSAPDVADVAPVADAPAAPVVAATRAGMAGMLGLLWLAGSVVTGLYVAAGRLRVRRWGHTAPEVDDARLLRHADEIVDAIGIRRPIRLVWLDAATPMTWGVGRPVVSLPRVAAEWDDERQRLVLLHELTHVARLDALAQTAAQAACVLFWWHPLVWLAARQLTHERECACDDAVLARGARASSYAQHLLDIARALRIRVAGPGAGLDAARVLLPTSALAMARRSELDGRLRAILTAGRRRDSLTRMHASATATLALALALPFAAVKPWSGPDDGSSESVVSDLPAVSVEGLDDFQRTFSVRPGGTLTVRTEAGTIEVEPWSRDAVEVSVENTFGERFRISATQSGNDVRVDGRWAERRAMQNWGRNQRLRFVVHVPERYNTSLNTSGGSIEVGSLTGAVSLNTSGGSLSIGDIRGTVEARTSGGSVSLASATGNATLRTSGGSMSAGRVGGRLVLNTSGGSISLNGGADGGVDGETSGGTISATLDRQPRGDVRLSTSGGSIRVGLANGVSMNLDASTSAGRVRSAFHSGTPRESLRAPIGNGGPLLRLRTSAGNVEVSRAGRSGEARTGEVRTRTWSADEARRAARVAVDAERIALQSDLSDAARRHALESATHSIALRNLDIHIDEAALDADLRRLSIDAQRLAAEAMRDVDVEAITREAMESARAALSDPAVKADLARAQREVERSHVIIEREIGKARREVSRDVQEAHREAAEAMREAQREAAQARTEAQREAAQARAEAQREAAQARMEARRDRAEAQREAEEARREAQREAEEARREAQREAVRVRRSGGNESAYAPAACPAPAHVATTA